MPPIPQPDFDSVCSEILSAYSVISRQRRYAGSNAVPLPISCAELEVFLASHRLMIDRDEFEAGIYALDDAFRTNWAEQQERARKHKKNK